MVVTRNKDAVVFEEQAEVGTEDELVGAVRARKRVVTEPYQQVVERGVEHGHLESEPVADGDDGEVHVLPDGSVSIPVFEEQVVLTKRLVVRERVVLRKHTVYEEQHLTTELRRELLDVDASDVPEGRVTGDLTDPDRPSTTAGGTPAADARGEEAP